MKTSETPTHDLQLVNFNTSELAPYHKNPRRGNTQAIAESLEINGQYRPIVVNLGTHTGRPLEVLAGNHTLAAAKRLGWETIACSTIDVDDIQAARIVAADNRLADLGGYDDTTLINLLQDINDEDNLTGTGYTTDDLDELLKPQDTPEPPPATYYERFEVVVECQDEAQQETLYRDLVEEGYTCRLLSL